jgi:hypothetical protein
MANFILPYEPASTAHITAEQKRIETKNWVSRRIREIEQSRFIERSPSIAPAHMPEHEKADR